MKANSIRCVVRLMWDRRLGRAVRACVCVCVCDKSGNWLFMVAERDLGFD